MTLGMFEEDFLRAFVLFGNDSAHLFVYDTGGFFAIRFGKTVFLSRGIIVREIRKFVAHTEVGDDSVSLLGNPFEVVGGSGRDAANEKLFGSSSSQCCTHLVEHSFFGGDLSFFGEIPCSTEGFSARYDSYFYKRVGILQEPAQ